VAADPDGAHRQGLEEVLFSPDGRYSTTASDDQTVVVCDQEPGVPMAGQRAGGGFQGSRPAAVPAAELGKMRNHFSTSVYKPGLK
jgi:hypothetical protein